MLTPSQQLVRRGAGLCTRGVTRSLGGEGGGGLDKVLTLLQFNAEMKVS